VKCLSSHLSSFAVIAENLTILKQIEMDTPVTITPTTEPPTSMNHISFKIVFIVWVTAQMPCCCSVDVQQYRDFNVTWNVTDVGKTVVTDCKADGVVGKEIRNFSFFV